MVYPQDDPALRLATEAKIPPLVAAAIATDPTIAASAANMAQSTVGLVPVWKASTSYTAGQRVIAPNGDVVAAKVAFTSATGYSATNWNPSSQDGRIGAVETTAPRKNSTNAFRVRDKVGSVAFSVTPEGHVSAGPTSLQTIPDAAGVAFRIRDKSGAVAFAVNADGTIPGFTAGAALISAVHVIIGAGQSNMSGRGTPAGSDHDPVDSRIFQYGSGASSITPATVPLDMHDAPTGISPLSIFAREYIKTLPPTVAVLLVPAAHGGTGFSTAAPLTWDPAATGGLYSEMIAQTHAALTAAQSRWGVAPQLTAMLWHQGEGDSGLTPAQYGTYLDALIAGTRSDLSDADLPVIVGQMSPDWVAANAGPLGIQSAHMDTPARMHHTAFAASAQDTGRHNDLVHFGRAGIESLGKEMHRVLSAARANQDGLLPMPPTNLRAVKAAGVITAYWDAPLCRVLGYNVEYRVGAGSWTAITGRTIAAQLSQALPATATEVRVSTSNPAGPSRFTAPAPVQGA